MHATTSWAAFVWILLVFVVPTSSQQTSEAKDSLYSLALLAGVDQMQKQWGYIDDGDRGNIRTDYHHMIVRKTRR